MNKHQAFDAWAPPSSIWSVWAKPILFAHMRDVALNAEESSERQPVAPWPPPSSSERIAIFLDLPGAQAVAIAVEWAQAGYRPVPVYNAAPAVGTIPPTREVVEVRPIVEALQVASAHLLNLQLPNDAPPIFMLDSNRRIGLKPSTADSFDNRSVSLPTDFPSAAFLISRGIQSVLLVGSTWPTPQADLAHTLRRYQEAGIRILSRPLSSPEPATTINIAAPRWYRWAFQRLLAALGLSRNPLGGFGGVLSEGSSG